MDCVHKECSHDLLHFIDVPLMTGLIEIEYCPTDQMHADYATKALQGKLFIDHWSFMMNQPLFEPSKRAVSHYMRERPPG